MSFSRRGFGIAAATTAASAAAQTLTGESSASVTTSQLIEFIDFSKQKSGMFTGQNSLVGPGVAYRTYRMKPGSSTKASLVPTKKPYLNPYRLIRVGSFSSSTVYTGLEVGGFTLAGTNQGHLYGGLLVGYSWGTRIHDLRITGIPGNSYTPPGETFSLALYHANGARLYRVGIDGRDATGTPVAATLFGINDCNDVVLTSCWGHHARYGMGISVWDSSNITLNGMDLRNCRHPINFENAHSGLMRIVSPDMRGQTDTGPQITVNSNIASTKVVISDPRVDSWPLRVGVDVSGRLYQGKPQLQRVQDISVYIAGVNVTGDRSKVRIGNVW